MAKTQLIEVTAIGSLAVETRPQLDVGSTPNLPSRRKSRHGPRLAAGFIVTLVHALAIAALANLRAASYEATDAPPPLEVRLIVAPPEPLSRELDMPPMAAEVMISPPEFVTIDEAFGATKSMQPPRMDTYASPDIHDYSRSLAMTAGQIVTIQLLVDVDAKGRVTRALLVRSTGTAQADEAAVAYARATRWVPGQVAGGAQAMQASLTVVFSVEPVVSSGT